MLKTPAIVVVVGLDVVVVVVVKKMISFAVYFTYCAMRSLSGCNCVSTSIKVESSNSKTLGGTPHFSSKRVLLFLLLLLLLLLSVALVLHFCISVCTALDLQTIYHTSLK